MQGLVLRPPPENIAHATFMQPLQCDLQPQLQETHRTTHTGTTTCCKTHSRNQSRPERPQPHPSHTRGTFHRRLQPLYTEKHKVSCSGFLPNSPLAFVTASFLTTSHRHHIPSSPLPIVTTSHRCHLPSSTSLPHHFPSSPASFDYVLLDHAPPFIIVNSRASYSFVMCIGRSRTTLQYC